MAKMIDLLAFVAIFQYYNVFINETLFHMQVNLKIFMNAVSFVNAKPSDVSAFDCSV